MGTEFSKYIKVLRYNNQMGIRRLAKKTGFSMKYLLDLEAGKTPPTEEVVESLISAYNLDVNNRRLLYNFAADALNTLPFDVIRYLRSNPQSLTKVIDEMHHYNENEKTSTR